MAFSILPSNYLKIIMARVLLVDGSSHKVDLNFAADDRRIVKIITVCRGN
jgi:hypothetical protein